MIIMIFLSLGPVDAILLVRLLERNVGITSNTLVWKGDMETWQPISTVSRCVQLSLHILKSLNNCDKG